jgi:hypothetical protein
MATDVVSVIDEVAALAARADALPQHRSAVQEDVRTTDVP